MLTAVISVVFAVLLLGATYLFAIFIMPLGPLAMFAVSGLWLIPPIFIAYILRRPGAALLTQAMIRTALVPFSPWGWMELTAIVASGLPIELVFLATRYRNYRLFILMLAGIVPGLVDVVIGWVPFGLVSLSIEMQIAAVAVAIISGALGGWLAKILADAIAKTGVLSSYAVGQEHQKEI